MAHEVILYYQPGCADCDYEMEFLSQRGVPFTAKNVIKDRKALREVLALGSRSTPTTVIDGKIVIGFDRQLLNDLLDGTS